MLHINRCLSRLYLKHTLFNPDQCFIRTLVGMYHIDRTGDKEGPEDNNFAGNRYGNPQGYARGRGQGHWRGQRNRGYAGDRRYNKQGQNSDGNYRGHGQHKRGGKERRRERDYGAAENYAEDEASGHNRGNGRPPPGLRGREIGMFYARRSQAKKQEDTVKNRADVSLEADKKREITQLLHGIKSSRDCPPQPDRYREMEDEDFDDVDRKMAVKREAVDDWFEQDSEPGTSAMSSGRNSASSLNSKFSEVKVEVKQEADGRQVTMQEEETEEEEEEDEVTMVTDMLQYNKAEDCIMISDEEDLGDYLSGSVRSNRAEEWNTKLYDEYQKKQNDKRYQNMLNFRKKLPSYKDQSEIVAAIEQNQVVVLSGETGCGKTTQVPQYILDDMIRQRRGGECRIICTQPRRISAITVAERVAAERAENCGESAGYMIRLENKMPRDTGSIMYCTTGILLKMLETDKLLSRATHIVLDEIHERDLLSDFLIIVLKDIIKLRPDLRLILMSATLNAQEFSTYYDNCPMIKIPGFTFPVDEHRLEDVIELLQYRVPDNMLPRKPRRQQRDRNEDAENFGVWLRNLEGGVNTGDKRYSRNTIAELSRMDMDKIDKELIVDLIRYIATQKDEGAILVFVPGWAEISDIHKMMMSDRFFNSSRFKIIPLHSMMPTVNQKDVFNRPPAGVRKVILATNIAETSITIDDVVYVVDSGRIKMKGFNPETNMSNLDTQLVSKANARQRRGRAGRVQPGECYHLYTGYQESIMEDYQPPEILRTRLEDMCLQIKNLKLGKIIPFVSKAMQPPQLLAIEKAICTLQDLNALDKDENLLPLGKHLAKIPLDPHSGKMLLFGAMFGCLNPILTIVASLNFKEPFHRPLEKSDQADQAKMKLADDCCSDHILLVKAFQRFERAQERGDRRHWCWQNFMSENTLMMLQKMRRQLSDLVYEIGFVDSKSNCHIANVNSDNEKLVKAIVCAGLYPNIASINKLATKHRSIRFSTKDGTRCELHPGSVAKVLQDRSAQFAVYHKIMKTTSVFMYDCSVVSPYSLLFFGGEIKQVHENGQDLVCVDDWIKFKARPDSVALVQDLRRELDTLLDDKIRRSCATDWHPNSKEGAILRAIINLVT